MYTKGERGLIRSIYSTLQSTFCLGNAISDRYEKKTKDTFFYARRFSIIGSFIRIELTNTRKARAFYGMLNIELISLKQPWPYSAYIEVGGFWPPSPLIPL